MPSGTIWATRNGVSGCLITGPNGNTMFLPAAGLRYDYTTDNRGACGYYWGRTLDYDFTYAAHHMDFYSGYMHWTSGNRYYGNTVRAVRVSQN